MGDLFIFSNPPGTGGGGGGNVSAAGTPTSGQIAQWTSSTTIQGVAVTGSGSVVLAVSPAFTGTPTAPTATAGTNTTQVATTAFVTTAVGGVSGSGAWVYQNKTANYTAAGYEHVFVDSTLGNIVITLPAVTGGKPVQVTKISVDTNTVTVTPASGLIDGLTNFSIRQRGESIDTAPDGTNWWIY